jgi:hypothetical protein
VSEKRLTGMQMMSYNVNAVCPKDYPIKTLTPNMTPRIMGIGGIIYVKMG